METDKEIDGVLESGIEVEELVTKLDGKVVISIDEVKWNEAGSELKWAVLVKMASGKIIRKGELVKLFEKVWKLKVPAEFFKVEKNVLLAQLMNQEDQTKVLEGGPWSLEGDAILTQRWEPGMTGEDFANSKINTWVHIYGLPYELRRPDHAELLASYVGRVKEEGKGKGSSKPSYEGEYMRVRLELDTQKPILPGMFLRRCGRKPVWISLKYERLPHVCYYCGRMNHLTKGCKEKSADPERGFGGWLKAEDQTRWSPTWSDMILEKKNVEVVEMTPERTGEKVADREPEREDEASKTAKAKLMPQNTKHLTNGNSESCTNEINRCSHSNDFGDSINDKNETERERLKKMKGKEVTQFPGLEHMDMGIGLKETRPKEGRPKLMTTDHRTSLMEDEKEVSQPPEIVSQFGVSFGPSKMDPRDAKEIHKLSTSKSTHKEWAFITSRKVPSETKQGKKRKMGLAHEKESVNGDSETARGKRSKTSDGRKPKAIGVNGNLVITTTPIQEGQVTTSTKAAEDAVRPRREQ